MHQRAIMCLERPAKLYPEKLAVIDAHHRMTYGEFAAGVNRLANGLGTAGVGRGDAVAVLCVNHHRYLQLYFACHALGAVIVPLNIRLMPPEIVYILNDSRTKLLFIDRPFLGHLETIRDGARHLDDVYYSDFDEVPEGLLPFTDLVKGQSDAFEPEPTADDDVMGYFYTGGTTGEPKGVMLTNRNLVSNAFHLQSMIHYGPDDRYLHIAPMFHLADAASIYALTMVGGVHVFGRAFEPKLTLELVQEHRVTMLILVPTMVNFVLAHADFGRYDLTSLRHFLYGASPMPVPLLRRAIEKIPCLPLQGYGMTEAAPLVSSLSGEDHRRGYEDPAMAWLLGTAGQPVPGVEMKIVNPEGREVNVGEAGEIIVRGPNIMKGYLNKPEATAEAIRNGWYHSGDVAIRNECGYFTIVDRMKDMIISGGENIYTTEVENVIMQFPGMLETTVVGVPDDQWGEVVRAFVVMKPHEAAGEAEIIEFCRQRLAHYKCPKAVEFLTELPKSGAGKILKRELRKAYWGDKQRQVN